MIKKKLYIVVLFSLLLLTLSLLAGCAGSHNIINDTNGNQLNASKGITKLDSNSSAYIGLAKDNITKGKLFLDSGLKTSEMVAHVFNHHFNETTLSEKNNSELNNIAFADKKGFSYLLQPKILKWSNNYTFWTGVPDDITVKLNIYDVKNKKIIDSFTINSVSSITPSFTQKPYDLLYQPLMDIASILFDKSNHTVI